MKHSIDMTIFVLCLIVIAIRPVSCTQADASGGISSSAERMAVALERIADKLEKIK